MRLGLSDVCQKVIVVKDIDSQLVVEQDSCIGNRASWLVQENTPVILHCSGHKKLEVDMILVLEIFFGKPSCGDESRFCLFLYLVA